MIVATISSLAQLATGHQSADGVAETQPPKLAAFEGHYEANAPGDLYLIGWVNKKTQEVKGIKIPGGLSFLVHWNTKEPVKGLNAFPPEDQPTAVNAIFQFYHLMVAFGMFFIVLTLFGTLQWWRGKIFSHRWFLWILVFSVFLPQLANQFGWFAAEMGRQPWVVYGLLRTSDGLSEAVNAGHVVFSLIFFTMIYALLLVLFLYLLDRKIRKGPYDESDVEDRLRLKDIAVQFEKSPKLNF